METTSRTTNFIKKDEFAMRILNSTFLAETFFKMYDVVDACTI
jgi:hypothetical protein